MTPTHMSRSSVVWRVIGYAGEVLITLGIVLLLAVAYELWWTNVQAQQNQTEERTQLQETWAAQPTPQPIVAPIPAEAFGLMYIPRLRDHVWATPLIEGVDSGDLARGLGHFPGTAMPGEVGNTAFAGHRATHGEPLAHVDQLEAGDLVYIETAAGWYTYRLRDDQIVEPTDIWVVDPVPGQPASTTPTESLLTLLTCEPRWGSTHRWVWWGTLTDSRSREQGPPPDLATMMTGA